MLEDGTDEISIWKRAHLDDPWRLPLYKTLTIPSTVDGHTVTSIDTIAYDPATSIIDSVTFLREYAFFLCDNLTSITIPDSVTHIDDRAFHDCPALTSIIVTPNSYAHQYCSDNNLPFVLAD